MKSQTSENELSRCGRRIAIPLTLLLNEVEFLIARGTGPLLITTREVGLPQTSDVSLYVGL